jgi:hypothetical protein
MAKKAGRRGKPQRGCVQVMSWEELARSLFSRAKLPFEVPLEESQKSDFFSRKLPELMAHIVQENFCPPEYDALVVDEAQDHDTSVGTLSTSGLGPGWWGIYFKLLREGPASPIALFYDPAQRPVFRDASGFEERAVRQALQAGPVKLQLIKSVRYSRPLLSFLKTLRTAASAGLVDSLQQRGELPEGPEVEIYASTPAQTPELVLDVIKRWIQRGLCRLDDILILSQHGQMKKSALGERTAVGRYPLADFLQRQPGAISRTSVNKAKGLDALGVILLDFSPFESISDGGQQISYFMGASRARQLLAIVHKPVNAQSS